MNQDKGFKIDSYGLICDNPECGWSDHNIIYEDYSNYINTPCPNCGDNILTQEDYDSILKLNEYANILNNFKDEDIIRILEDPEYLNITNELFKRIEDGNLNKELSFSIHNGIKVKAIEKE